MSVKVVSLKCSPDEHEAWKKAAGPSSFNSWARALLNAGVGNTQRQEVIPQPFAGLPESRQPIAGDGAQIQAARKRRKVQEGKSGSCVHHLPLGAFCPQCGS